MTDTQNIFNGLYFNVSIGKNRKNGITIINIGLSKTILTLTIKMEYIVFIYFYLVIKNIKLLINDRQIPETLYFAVVVITKKTINSINIKFNRMMKHTNPFLTNWRRL